MGDVNDFSMNRRLELASKVLARHRIYLDQKYWIALREAKLGNPEKQEHVEILKYVSRLIDHNKIICPASSIVFEETLAAKKLETRIKHAEIIDLFSNNIAIQPQQILSNAELLHFVRRRVRNETNLHPIEAMVWNHIAHLAGEMLPYYNELDQVDNDKIQVEYLKHMDQLSLKDIIVMIENSISEAIKYDTAEHAEKQTINQKLHEHEFDSFHEVYLSEVAGILDVMTEDIRSLWNYLCKDHAPPGEDPALAAEALKARLFKAFYDDEINKELPGIHISAGIYAAKRYKSKQQGGPYAKKGDIKDHFHARTALPYFDAFFTERKLGLILTENPLKFDVQYNCKILWEENSIIDYLNNLCEEFEILI